jgi:hypothetical protein
MVHHLNVLAPDATPPPDCRIVTKEKLEWLRTAVKGMATALASGDSWADPGAVGEQLRSRLLTAGDMVSRYSTTTRASKGGLAIRLVPPEADIDPDEIVRHSMLAAELEPHYRSVSR